MKSLSVFDHRNYKEFLNQTLSAKPGGGRGWKKLLAKAAGIQPAYLSRVLSGDAELSLGQAFDVSIFLGQSESERHFFLTLVQVHRADTPRLQDHFQKELKRLREDRGNLSKRFQVQTELSQPDKQIYYSRWYYSAIHILVSIPEYQDLESLSRKIGLPVSRVSKALEFLISTGLVRESKGRYSVGVTRIHLGKQSEMLSKHHINWRLKALSKLEETEAVDHLHYTSVVSLSIADLGRLQRKFIEILEDYNRVVADSPEEESACLILDWFRF